MKPEDEAQAIETTREAFRNVSYKHRTLIFKKAGHNLPRTTGRVFRAAHISTSFQLKRIEHWFRTEHQDALEKVVLSPDHPDHLETLLRAFFCNAYPSMNNYLLGLIDRNAKEPMEMEDALKAVSAKFSQDPYLDLYVASIRWLCAETMAPHEDQPENANGAENGGSTTIPVAQPQSPDTTALAGEPATTTSPSSPDDLGNLDRTLQEVSDAVAKLRDVQTADLPAATTSLQRAHSLSASLADAVNCLAADLGEPTPQWSSREEFVAHRTRLTALAAGRTEMHKRAAILVNEVSQLLAGVNIRHRIPSRSVALTALARDAVAQIAEHAAGIRTIILGHSGSACDWLNWLWQQEGEEAECYQQKLRPLVPALADLVAQAHWPDLQWSAAPPAKDHPEAPTQPEVQSSPPTEQAHPSNPPSAAPTAIQPPPAVPPAAVAAPPEAKPQTPTIPELIHPLAVLIPSGSSPAAACTTRPTATPQPATKPAASTPTEAAKPRQSTPVPAAPPPPPRPPSQHLLESESPALPPRPSLVAATWRLARANRWGLASHLAALADPPALPPSWIFQAAALAPRISYEISPISDRLTEIFACSADFRPESLGPDACPPTRLLLAAVALRPALLAPKTNAAAILKLSGLKDLPRLHALDQFVERVAEFGLHRQALCPEMLRSSHNRDDWERQLAHVHTEVGEWLEQAPSRGFNYAVASRIWRGWTGPNGQLRRLLEETIAANPQNAASMKAKWEPWDRRAADLIQSATREITHRKTMEGTARDTLISRIRETVRLADRVLVLLSQAPQPGGTFQTEQAPQLPLPALRQNLRSARQELEGLLSQTDDALAAAASFCDTTLQQTEYLLQGHLPLPGGEEPNPRLLLDAELLRDPAFTLAPNGTVLPPGRSQIDQLLILAQSTPDWVEAWSRQDDAKNHAATAALLEYFRWQPQPGVDITSYERKREDSLQNSRREIEKESIETHRLLDEFASLGFCREKDYLNWSAEVRNVKDTLSDATVFAGLHARLQKIRDSVQEQRKSEIARVRQRLAATPAIKPADLERITHLLDVGDIHTATDYLDRVAQGLSLPESSPLTSTFQAFFGDDGWLCKNEATLHDAPFNDCWQAAQDGAAWRGLDFQFLGRDQRLATISHLQLWQELERKRRAVDQEALQLAGALGLQALKVEQRPGLTGSHTIQHFIVHAQPVAERTAAVVPAFGSDANGRYTLHLVWGEPDAEELLYLCHHETGDTTGHIVVAFRVLNTKERRELAEEARKPDRVFKAIVVDRALFAFACAQPTARLSTILRCALPFSCVEPYTISAGEVPPEMFFGRGRELNSLAEPRGSCFVYGGRQLGKTALLRALERRFHNLRQGRAAIFLSLKDELFSRGRPADDLWSIIVARFKEAGVLSDIKVGATAGHEALFRHIKEWLHASPERRLLLLLDEADHFLEQDGKETDHYEPFPRCQRLKGLMDDTSRRFKVIFAGLHNVQRTTRSSNHPLAHFGDAICIGPMLEEAESREARALVEQPLAAAGYVFESADVVSRILALTNYYPSLIQLFCHHLVRDLRANHVTRFPQPRLTPPCVITSNHVQSIYGSIVRKRIHEKVRLTLDLDKRYEIIAYLLAFYGFNQSGLDGLDLRDIRDAALDSWPAGFAEMRTDDEFRGLLEEMVGLGILRQVSGVNRFALRNENVTTLLGTQEEIERHLDSAKTWEPALKYEAHKFRRHIASRPRLIFSPLTAQQENDLLAAENRVVILYGVEAAGLAAIPDAMESLSQLRKLRTHTLGACADASAISDQIADIERPPDSHTIVIVPTDAPWDELWVGAASQRIAQFTSKDAFLTVLFVAGPVRAAATLRETDAADEADVRFITLRPWHDATVHQWLRDLGLDHDTAMRARILAATGNWQTLLMELDTASNDSLRHSCDQFPQLLQDPQRLSYLRRAFGFSKELVNESLRIAAELKQFTREDVLEFVAAENPHARQNAIASIDRAQRLGLISVVSGGLSFDHVAATILLQEAKTA